MTSHRVIVFMEGGVLQNVLTSDDDVDVIAIDWDEVKERAYSSAELREMALEADGLAPFLARDLRAAADEQDEIDSGVVS